MTESLNMLYTENLFNVRVIKSNQCITECLINAIQC